MLNYVELQVWLVKSYLVKSPISHWLKSSGTSSTNPVPQSPVPATCRCPGRLRQPCEAPPEAIRQQMGFFLAKIDGPETMDFPIQHGAFLDFFPSIQSDLNGLDSLFCQLTMTMSEFIGTDWC